MSEVKFGHKILYFLKEVDRIMEGIYQMPVSFEIDASNYCQNDCGFCMFAFHLKKNRVHLPMSLYYKALLSFRRIGVKSITFTGGGEPLMNPNIVKMIGMALSENMRVGLVTNGLLLPDIYDIAPRLEFIRVSIDSATRDTYRKVKGRDHFNEVCDNIRGITKHGEGTVGISFVVTEDNKHEVDKFHALASDLDVEYAQIKPELKVCDMESQIKNIEGEKFFVTERYNIDQESLIQCKIAGLVGILGATGKLYYCCVHRGKDNFVIGDLATQELHEIFYKRHSIIPSINMCSTSCRYMNYAKIYEQVVGRQYIPFRHRKFI